MYELLAMFSYTYMTWILQEKGPAMFAPVSVLNTVAHSIFRTDLAADVGHGQHFVNIKPKDLDPC